MRDTNLEKPITGSSQLLFRRSILPVVAFVSAYVSGLLSKGPLYLTDESTYLAKAAVISGYTSDMASSWFAGYAIFLAPLFYFLSDVDVIWRALCVLQAFALAINFFLLERIIREVSPDMNEQQIQHGLIFTFLYPSFLVFTSYAFVTTFTSLLLTASVYFRITSMRVPSHIVLSGILSGFLFWMHPVGIGAVIGFIADRIVSRQNGRLAWHSALAVLLCVIIATFYFLFFHSYLNNVMTASGFPQYDHYRMTGRGVLFSLFDPIYLYGILLVLIGQISYFTIGTFGFALASLIFIVMTIRKNGLVASYQTFARSRYAVLTLPIVGVGIAVFLTALSFGVNEVKRPDRLIFGRYTEHFLFPLMPFIYATGMSAMKDMRQFVKWAIAIIGLNSLALIPVSNLIVGITFDTIGVMSFWPTYLFWGLPLPVLLLIGLAGTLIMVPLRSRYGPMILLVIFACCLAGSMRNQHYLASWSKPTSFAKAVRETIPSGGCVGVLWPIGETREGDMYEEQARYSFPLFDYDLRRVTSEQWKQFCQGPLLVPGYSREPVPTSAKLIAYAPDTKLSIYFPKDRDAAEFLRHLDPREFSRIAPGS